MTREQKCDVAESRIAFNGRVLCPPQTVWSVLLQCPRRNLSETIQYTFWCFGSFAVGTLELFTFAV